MSVRSQTAGVAACGLTRLSRGGSRQPLHEEKGPSPQKRIAKAKHRIRRGRRRPSSHAACNSASEAGADPLVLHVLGGQGLGGFEIEAGLGIPGTRFLLVRAVSVSLCDQ